MAAWPAELPAPTMWTSRPCAFARLAARGAVRDALAGEPVESLDRQVPPRDAAGEDDRPRPQDVAAVEVHLARRGVDPRDRPGHEDLGAEPAAPAAAHGSPARRRTRLTGSRGSSRSGTTCRPGRRAPPARSRSSAGPPTLRTRPRPGRRARRRRSPCRTRRRPPRCARPSSSATRRSCGRTTVLPLTTPNRRPILLGRQRTAPLLGRIGRVGRHPLERDLVAVEEAAQLRAGGIPAMPDDDRSRRRRLGRDALQPAGPLIRLAASLPTSLPTSGAAAATAW